MRLFWYIYRLESTLMPACILLTRSKLHRTWPNEHSFTNIRIFPFSLLAFFLSSVQIIFISCRHPLILERLLLIEAKKTWKERQLCYHHRQRERNTQIYIVQAQASKQVSKQLGDLLQIEKEKAIVEKKKGRKKDISSHSDQLRLWDSLSMQCRKQSEHHIASHHIFLPEAEICDEWTAGAALILVKRRKRVIKINAANRGNAMTRSLLWTCISITARGEEKKLIIIIIIFHPIHLRECTMYLSCSLTCKWTE